ncbi:MAG: nuclear transport factor 2 family protein [Myxococcota bacterium]
MATHEQLEERVRVLESRLRAVEDIEAIKVLKARYGELVDARYDLKGPKGRSELEALAKQIADLFTADAVWDGGRALGVCKGRDEICERFLKPTLRFSWHYFVKPRIEVEGDSARGRWDILSPCTTRDGRPHWMAGVEDDEYAKVDGRWLHSRMKLSVVFLAPHDVGWASVNG